jgi:hypothetical protein
MRMVSLLDEYPAEDVLSAITMTVLFIFTDPCTMMMTNDDCVRLLYA